MVATTREPDSVLRWSSRSEDPDVARDVLAEYYATELSLRTASARVRMRLRSDTVGELSVGRLSYGVPLKTETGPMSAFTTVVVLAGSMEAGTVTSSRRHLDAGEVWSWRSGEGMSADLPADVVFGTVTIPSGAFENTVAAGVRFLASEPVDAAAGRYWARLMGFTDRQLNDDDCVLAHPLARRHWQETLGSAALQTFPNSTMITCEVPGPGWTGPATVRRALTFAQDNAERAVGVAEMARAAGIGTRALQAAFEQHVGTTPTNYLRRVRLVRAHEELLAGDPSVTSVADVAVRWGFGSPSAFAAAYRREHGSSPSSTLRG